MNEYLMNNQAHQKLNAMWQEASEARKLPRRSLRQQLARMLRNVARVLDAEQDQKGVLA
ncbi:hypothetical protein [Deinococcus cellulosilyticus]|uniref:Uncharacterized protein n=1 Tax=Deinococcus cellulosilyticus (strain DSM 18568 / NBRC 106333 / KACC 11606 / 5516J-15) TaxID=1223518 RepID=A0A511N6J3_DEIC1|nr:hypothetical protein [Deinococcus cellulosilyticus]GEM48492.1 hypothetical protein DC3_41270 [Deinococcus cellulosilyticus NBRC 106333 = KACC 11606]